MTMQWKGVIPALTTGLNEDLSVDRKFVARHCRWLIDNGCTGIVALGSIGEGATLRFEEKLEILETCIASIGDRAPVAAAVSSLSTDESVRLARAAAERGCKGLMVLPPYVYQGDWRETRAHMEAIFRATDLSCMLYNNPVAYGTDFTPPQIGELAGRNANLHAVKESSTDVRRVTAIRASIGDRLAILVGVDDAIVEGIRAGAVGWIAGLVNALPRESVELFNLASAGRDAEADELYKWFLPLLRFDTMPKLVQLIKLVQEEVGMGSARVRPPRLQLQGDELKAAKQVIAEAFADRPTLAAAR
jgi:4-hydroxy-tetrahydrodipicolinate synthase